MRDVVVVGGGPAGLHAAYQLASAGLDVILLEARPEVGDGVVCTGVISEEAFRRFNLPTSPVLTEIRRVEAVSPVGTTLTYQADAPLAYVVDKGEFNRALAAQAAAAGAEILLGRHVELLWLGRDGITVRSRLLGKRSETLKARVAVIASGVDSKLNQSLRLAQPLEFLRGIQAEVEISDQNGCKHAQVYVGRSVAPGAFGWVVPTGNSHARVGLMTTENPLPYFKGLLRKVAADVNGSPLKIKQKKIAQVPLGKTFTDRVLVIGEAAGHVKATTGGGIYYGLLSAEFAAEVIRRAFRMGSFTSHALADYERYWRKAFGKELLVGYFARKLAACLEDHQLESIFRFANRIRLLARLDGRLKFDWHHEALLLALRSLLPKRVGGSMC